MPKEPQKERSWKPDEDLVDGPRQSMRLMDAFLRYLLERKKGLQETRALGPVQPSEADEFFREIRSELASLNARERWAERERARAERLLSTFQDPSKFRRWVRHVDSDLARRLYNGGARPRKKVGTPDP